jgi:hypothetical protein
MSFAAALTGWKTRAFEPPADRASARTAAAAEGNASQPCISDLPEFDDG